jgi:antitoxin component YwqK of YwqJK toxin-antitoxin module
MRRLFTCDGIGPETRLALFGGCAALALIAAGCNHEEPSTNGQPVADTSARIAPVTSSKAGNASTATNAANPDFTDDQILKDIDKQTKQAGPAPKFEKYQDLTIQWDALPGNPKDPDVAAAAEFKTPRNRQRWKVFSDGSKIRDGKYEEWYRNGQRSILGEYVDDSRQGPWRLWHENGKPCKTENYLNGKLEGKWDVLSDKGLLEQKVSYHEGERNGIWTIYAVDGKTPVRRESYKAGAFDGEQRIYYPNGNLRLVQEFKDGVPDGKETKYAEDGKTVKEDNVYDRGRKVSSSTGGIAGK